MGNFKPRQFKPHNLVTIGGRQKILLRDEIEILELLHDGYWVEQNILRPKAIWLKHHEEREQPNISWNTFDHLLSRKFVKEHGTLHPIARFTITKHGEMEYDRLTKPKEAPKPADPTPIPPDLAVSSKPSVLEQQLKTAISFTDANLLRLKDNKYALVVHFDDFVSLMKATHTLGIDLPKEKDSPKQKRNVSYPNVQVDCFYCKGKFEVKKSGMFKEKQWHRACKNCTSKRTSEYVLFRKVYGRSPNENDS